MMNERRRWPLLRRVVDATAYLLSMLEEKRHAHRRLSMTRCAVAAFTIVYCSRLLFLKEHLGWPDAFLAFAVLFALPIGKALDKAPAQAVVEAVTGMFGKPGQAGTWYADTVLTGRAVDDPAVPMGRADL